jgi:hypothetical protein
LPPNALVPARDAVPGALNVVFGEKREVGVNDQPARVIRNFDHPVGSCVEAFPGRVFEYHAGTDLGCPLRDLVVPGNYPGETGEIRNHLDRMSRRGPAQVCSLLICEDFSQSCLGESEWFDRDGDNLHAGRLPRLSGPGSWRDQAPQRPTIAATVMSRRIMSMRPKVRSRRKTDRHPHLVL